MNGIFDTEIDDIHSLFRALNYELVKLKRRHHRPIVNKRNIEPTSLDDFVKNIDFELLESVS